MQIFIPVLIVIFQLMCSVYCAHAAEQKGGPVLTLEEAVSLALKQNRSVIGGRLEVEKAEQHVLAGEKRYFPVFDVRVSESYLLTSSDYTFERGVFGVFPGIGPVPAKETKIASLDQGWDGLLVASVGQPLSDLYKIHLGVRVLEADRDIAREKLRSQRATVVSDVKRAYFTMVQTQSACFVATELVTSLKELERVVKNQIGQRAALEPDLLEVRAKLAKAEYDLFTFRNSLTSTRQQLNNLLGRDLRTEFMVISATGVDEEALDVDAAIARALEQRFELKESKLRQEQAEYAIKMKRSEYFPQVSLVFNYLTPFNTDFLPTNVSTVGFQLSWDVFDWGLKRNEIMAKARTLNQAGHAIREAEAAIAIDVQNRVHKLQEAEMLSKATLMAKDAAHERLRVTTNKYREKAVLLQDVLQVQSALADANHQHQAAMLALLTARAEYEQAIGNEPTGNEP